MMVHGDRDTQSLSMSQGDRDIVVVVVGPIQIVDLLIGQVDDVENGGKSTFSDGGGHWVIGSEAAQIVKDVS